MPGVPRELAEHKLEATRLLDQSRSSGDLQKIENKL
jgi:hypothetical protein